MRVGTKSVLFGAHCFFIHPLFVFVAWWKLYGFPWNPKLWIAFIVHDLGYIRKRNMDGPDGEAHVLLGAKIMHCFDAIKVERKTSLFMSDESWAALKAAGWKATSQSGYALHLKRRVRQTYWHDLCLYHSRFYAKQCDTQPSKLCMADKLAVALEPSWLYIPRATLSGEIYEYMHLAASDSSKYATMQISTKSKRDWFKDVKSYLRKWAYDHKNGEPDYCTPYTK